MGRKVHDLTGKRFGRLWVVGQHGSRNRQGKILWVCSCDCSKTIVLPSHSLVTGNTQSCGCLIKEVVKTGRKRQGKPYITLYKHAVRGVKTRGMDFISYEEFLEYTKIKECFYCGSKVTWSEHHPAKTGSWAYNLDRIDPSIGYTIGNLVVSCGNCNRAKGSLTKEEFINHCHKVADWQGEI